MLCKMLVFYSQMYQIHGKRVLGALAKLRDTAISFVMSVRLSVRMKQLDSHWKEFHKILY